tara:strand:- start:286 stop:987 length:702 start_codon:yes stop_codon:yes gene_type:complete
MDYTNAPPQLPTIGRWNNRNRRFPGESVLRTMEYENPVQLKIGGQVLDVGGGENARYTKFLTDADQISSINIDPAIEPTYLLQPGEPFPIADETFDNAVCLKTLEHINEAKFVIRETFRCLKKGGSVYITVPFIFRVHGHPDDYFRGTTSWWKETMDRTGFSSMELQPLIWGRSTTARLITGYRGPFSRLRFHMTHIADSLYAGLTFRGDSHDDKRGERICAIAPGYFIKATR